MLLLQKHDAFLYGTIMVQVRTYLSLYFTHIEVTVLVFVDVFVNSQLDPEIMKNEYYLHF